MIRKLKERLRKSIVTVTLNPALDQTVWVKDFRVGTTLLAERSKPLASGKGVNVSRALRSLGIVSTSIGILPENGAEHYLNLLNDEELKHDFLRIRGDLRINITILSNRNGTETHLRQRGAPVEPSLIERFKDNYRALKKRDTFFVFSGSLPPGLPYDTYQTLITDVSEGCAGTSFDSSGEALRQGLGARPSLIKPNMYEVKDALGFIPHSKKELLKACRLFHGMGIENVMISLGKRGIVLSQESATIHARVAIPSLINAVGCGDASHAGGLLGLLCNLLPEESARLACSLGAANSLESGACIFNTADVIELYKKVKITYW